MDDEADAGNSSRSRYGYFEKQNAKDCLLHSINNAFGRKVLEKQDVLDFIYETARKIYKKWCGSKTKDPEEEMERYLSNAMLEKDTMFSAKVMWAAALGTGTIKRIIKIPGFSSRYLALSELGEKDIDKVFPPWTRKKPIVVLGATADGSNHAIAVRDGSIYDSERSGPVPLTLAGLKGSLAQIHAAYAFE